MRIVVDAMGSDAAPAPDVEGALRAARRFGAGPDGVEIVLVGRQEVVEGELARHDTSGLAVSVVHAAQVIEMGEHPAEAVRSKPESSMVVGMGLVRQGQADAFVSAGNSGGTLAAALAGAGRVGRIRGIRRPAISAVLPSPAGRTLLLDVGANTDCRPGWLAQFAIMGATYAEQVLGIPNPRVALLSNGEEETKGSAAVVEAHAILRHLPLNFQGNVEGRDLIGGVADVVVADGFAGNVALKTVEGTATTLIKAIREQIKASPITTVGGLLARPAFRRIGRLMDYREVGGAPLLGVNGVVIISHGRSDALAIENAVRVAMEAVRGRVVERIREGVERAAAALEAASPEGARLLAEDE